MDYAGGGGNFTATFSSGIAAFGFYRIDIGDYGGPILPSLSRGTTPTVPNTIGSSGFTDDSVLCFGAKAQNTGEWVTSERLLSTTGTGDLFAFDNFAVRSAQRANIT